MIANADTEHVFVSFRRQLSIARLPAVWPAVNRRRVRRQHQDHCPPIEAAAEVEANSTMQNRLRRPKRACNLDHSRVPRSVNRLGPSMRLEEAKPVLRSIHR
jgi:hypothetical protein